MALSTRTTGTRTAATGALPGETAPVATGLLILGRYRLHRPLGTGGFGSVWLARDERLERDVAVKVLARDRVVGGRFEREAKAAARLSHPGIVTLYEAAVDDDGAYLVSELVRGSTLSQLLEAGRLSDRDIVEIGIALCEALAHAHGQGVVHRDVKPSNVLIPEHPSSPGQVAKLTDFGVARVLGADSLTRTGDVVGTAAYMAPEQAEGREAGAAADLYSLALVLYEALTGINPVATGPPAQRARRLGAHLPPLRRQRRDLPASLGHALDAALRPRARERGTVDGLRAELVSSLDRVEDRPGVIESPWPHLSSIRSSSQLEAPEAVEPEPGVHEDSDVYSPLRWPARVLAGLTAGLSVAWLTTLLPDPTSLTPPAAGAIACLAVAALPGIGWLALILVLGSVLAEAHRAGAALVVVLAAILPVLLIPRRRSSWPLPAAGAALGAGLLAGAWPVLAGRATGLWQRIALGALGWIWTVAAGFLAGRGLYTRLPQGLPAGWSESAGPAIHHVIPRLLEPGLLAPALLWGLAAGLLPWITARAPVLQVVLVTIWSAALASGTTTVLAVLHAGVTPRPAAVAIGAVAGGVFAVAPALLRWRATGSRSSDPVAGLA